VAAKGLTADRPAPARDVPPRNRILVSLLVAVLAVLGLTADERTLGTVTDEQQMLYTAVSLATFGEIGIAGGQVFNVSRPAGDAVSPYGMGLPLLEAPLAALARPWEARFGEHSSQTLFVLLQILLVTGAAAFSGLLARALGAGRFGEGLAVVATALGSPLWAYAATGLSEPLQALTFAGALCCAAAAAANRDAGRRAGRLAAAAGFFAGYAVLTKSANAAIAPLFLLPLAFGPGGRPAAGGRGGLLARAAAGSVLPLGAWLAFEIVRFGRPFASYGKSQQFNHPLFDGVWRLLVGPNKGLLFFFPLLVLAVAGLVALAGRRATRLPAAAIVAVSLVTLVIYSAWWAWDGTCGWGPRFLVPLVPLLSAAAGAGVLTRPGRVAAGCLTALGFGVNLLGVLTPEAASFHYVFSTGGVRVPPGELARYPASFREATGQTEPILARNLVARYDAAFAQIPLHLFLLRARLGGADPAAIEETLATPPWIGAHPDAVPDLPIRTMVLTTATPLVRELTEPFRWPHLGAAMARSEAAPPGTFNPAWRNALQDQIYRNLDIGRAERSVPLAYYLHDTLPSGHTAALVAESLRLAGRRDEARAFLAGLPGRVLLAPSVSIVRALLARDDGDEAGARARLSEAAARLRAPALDRALGSPLPSWPASLRLFLTDVPGPAVRAPVRSAP
jgi:hypothetical protein